MVDEADTTAAAESSVAATSKSKDDKTESSSLEQNQPDKTETQAESSDAKANANGDTDMTEKHNDNGVNTESGSKDESKVAGTTSGSVDKTETKPEAMDIDKTETPKEETTKAEEKLDDTPEIKADEPKKVVTEKQVDISTEKPEATDNTIETKSNDDTKETLVKDDTNEREKETSKVEVKSEETTIGETDKINNDTLKTPTKEKKEDDDEEEEEEEVPDRNTPAGRLRRKLGDFLENPHKETPVEGKRKRKAVIRHSPTNFPEPEEELKPGRGKQLAHIKSVEKNIRTRARNDPVFKDAYRLMATFNKKKKAPKVGLIKQTILGFSGYLLQSDNKEEEKAKREKFSGTAHKYVVPVLRDLCDFFDLDRRNKGKEQLVDLLTKFMAEPQEKLTMEFSKAKAKKASPKKRAAPVSEDIEEAEPPSKRRKAPSKEESDDAPPPSKEIKTYPEDAKQPNEDELRKWAQAYITCFNLEMATTKHAIETASDKFNADLSQQKKLIKTLLAEGMQQARDETEEAQKEEHKVDAQETETKVTNAETKEEEKEPKAEEAKEETKDVEMKTENA